MNFSRRNLPARALLAWGVLLGRLALLLLGAWPSQAQAPAPGSDGAATFQLPVERVSHAFSLLQRDAVDPTIFDAQSLTIGAIANLQESADGPQPTADSYLSATGTLTGADYYLRDDSTGATSPLQVQGTTGFPCLSFLATPWFGLGESVTYFFVVLPEARVGHTLGLVADGVEYSLAESPAFSYIGTDESGQPTEISYGFCEGWSTCVPSGTYYLIDHSTQERSDARGPANHDFINATQWETYAGLPTAVLLREWVDESCADQTYEVHADGAVTWVTPAYTEGVGVYGEWRAGYQFSAAVGMNQPFWIIRGGDREYTEGSIGEDDLVLADAQPYTPPYVPDFQYVTFPVGQSYLYEGFYVQEQDGSTAAVAQTGNSSVQVAYDGAGEIYYTYILWEYGGYVDVKQNYWLTSSMGTFDFTSGFNPPPPPPTDTFTVQVGENHWSSTILVRQADGHVVTATPNWSSVGAYVAYDMWGDMYYQYQYVYYSAVVDQNQEPYTAYEESTGNGSLMDGYNPPPPPPPSQESLYLNLPACRWNHTFEVRTDYGDIFPVVADQMQGFWTSNELSQSWFVSYYYLTASSSYREHFGWYVYDVTTGEAAPYGQWDLSSWSGWSAMLDSDNDGLADWYELLIGTDPYNADTNGDGLTDAQDLTWMFDPRDLNWRTNNVTSDGVPRAWIVAHGLDPYNFSPSDDPDGDGISNLDEYRGGTDPNRASPRLYILSPSNAVLLAP